MFRILVIGLFINTSLALAQNYFVDIKNITADIYPDLKHRVVSGRVEFSFLMLKDADSIFLDAKKMSAELIGANANVVLSTTRDKIWFKADFESDKKYTISFKYKAKPQQALYFVGLDDDDKNNDQVFTQGQGKYTSRWLPSIDDMNDKIEFDLSIIAPRFYGVIANGRLTEKWEENDSLSRWTYDMKDPMSSYLVAFSVGNYKRNILTSDSGIELHQYILKKDSIYIEPTYRHTKTIFDYLEKKIGVNFPWQNYKQAPIRDFLYAGMENTSLTLFSDAFVVDSIGYFDRNYVNVNAHELAHQWFGNMITETNSKHHWLHEGFATYYALLAEKQIFGENYFYKKLYEYAETLKARSDSGKGEKLLSKNASSLTYYQKGAWALVMLNHIVGEHTFDQAINNFLNKYAFQNVTTEDFMNEVKALTAIDLTTFEKQWFLQSAFQADQALTVLEESLFIQAYFDLISKRKQTLVTKQKNFDKVFEFPINEYLAQEAVYQLAEEPRTETVIALYKKAFSTNNVLIRQALSETLTTIPFALKTEYESLLNDQSYQTRENALLHLWINFPNERNIYLETMKDEVGFRDKNIKLLWLTLHLATPDFQANQTQKIFKTLERFTSPLFSFQVREHTFGYLYQIDAFSEQSLVHLVKGCFHHTWRFRDFCRKLLKTLLKNEDYKQKIKSLKIKLNSKEIDYLNTII